MRTRSPAPIVPVNDLSNLRGIWAPWLGATFRIEGWKAAKVLLPLEGVTTAAAIVKVTRAGVRRMFVFPLEECFGPDSRAARRYDRTEHGRSYKVIYKK